MVSLALPACLSGPAWLLLAATSFHTINAPHLSASLGLPAVVKCRVLGADPARKGLKLSLVGKSAKQAAAAAAAGAAGQEAPAAEAPAPAEEVVGGKKKKAAAGGEGDDAAAIALGSFQAGDVVAGVVTAVHTKEVRWSGLGWGETCRGGRMMRCEMCGGGCMGESYIVSERRIRSGVQARLFPLRALPQRVHPPAPFDAFRWAARRCQPGMRWQ